MHFVFIYILSQIYQLVNTEVIVHLFMDLSYFAAGISLYRVSIENCCLHDLSTQHFIPTG